MRRVSCKRWCDSVDSVVETDPAAQSLPHLMGKDLKKIEQMCLD